MLRATGVHLYAEIDVPDDAEPSAERPPAEQPEQPEQPTRG
jgi:hypothetical protein